MDLSSLTILIPSIGRKSLERAIKSVPKECEIKVLLQGVTDSDYISKITSLVSESKVLVFEDKLGAGPAKAELIKSVATEFFMILDDDDWIPKGYLQDCLELLEQGYKWVAPSIVGPTKEKEIDYRVIPDQEKLKDRLFHYKSFSELYARYHLYPCNSSILSTKEFRELKEFHHLKYADDLIPVLNFFIHYEGVFFVNRGLRGDEGDGSVSRRYISKDKLQAITRELIIKVFSSKTDVERDIWKQALTNTLDRVCHINSLYNERRTFRKT